MVTYSNLYRYQAVSYFCFDKPSNHGVDDFAISSALGVSVSSGAAISEEGIYYIYRLPISLQTSGYIESVTLDFDVEVNGAKLTGREVLAVR